MKKYLAISLAAFALMVVVMYTANAYAQDVCVSPETTKIEATNLDVQLFLEIKEEEKINSFKNYLSLVSGINVDAFTFTAVDVFLFTDASYTILAIYEEAFNGSVCRTGFLDINIDNFMDMIEHTEIMTVDEFTSVLNNQLEIYESTK